MVRNSSSKSVMVTICSSTRCKIGGI